LLLDHFVGASEQRRWDGDVDGAGSLQVQHQFELGWLDDRQVAGFLPLENAPDIAARDAFQKKLAERVRALVERI
jgi:hypothetical protein